jgi:hypothetical protein
MNAQLNHLIAEQHTQDRRQAAERDRLTRSVRADQAAAAPAGRITRLGATLGLRRPPAEIAC